MYTVEPSSPGEGGSSTSRPSRQAWIHSFLKTDEGTPEKRQPIRGIEAQLVDLVFQNSLPGDLMDWLRVPLECATAAGNLAVVKRLLAAGVRTEAPPKRPRRAPLLHLAAKSGNTGVVEEVLKAGVSVGERDSARGNRTALHHAANTESDGAVRALMRAGAKIDLMDAWGFTALHYACQNGNRGIVVFLLLQGAPTQLGRGDNFPPLHLAAANNHPGVIEDLLYFGKVRVGRHDRKGMSALHVAAKHHKVEACVALLRGGARAGPGRSNNMSCLDAAVSGGGTGQLLQILTLAEETDVRKRRCNVALFHAVLSLQSSPIRDLIALGADVEHRRPDSCTCLHLAVMRDADRVAKELLEAGAYVEARFHGETPLHLACMLSFVSTVQLLLYWGADEDELNLNGKFPFEVVGTGGTTTDEELPPEKIASNKLRDDRIRRMLETAPGDRSWRRRGWLILCRTRWLARIGAGATRCCPPLGSTPGGATGSKKRRGKVPDSSLVVKPRDFSVDKGNARRRDGDGGKRLPQEIAEAKTLRLGTCSVLSDGGAGLGAGAASMDGRTRFVAAVEQLLLLQEDSIFREVVAFL